jgi:hypothetical protein
MRQGNRGAELEQVLATHAAALALLAALRVPASTARGAPAGHRLRAPLSLRQAEVLGLSAGNFGVRLHRGKLLLKAALGEMK